MPKRSIEQDPETGKIVSATLDSETAAEMGRNSHKKRNSEAGNRLLEAEGFDADNPAPEHLAVLAEYAVGGKSGAVSALRDFRKLTGSREEASSVGRPLPGEVCPLCEQYVMAGVELAEGERGTLADYIGQVRGNGNE